MNDPPPAHTVTMTIADGLPDIFTSATEDETNSEATNRPLSVRADQTLVQNGVSGVDNVIKGS
ncbi:MAG: hypothetical protein KJ614_01990 [Gammaproteobacteria bacterium]|uniref:hypothetical protein n=1 Tax=Rhodoferax sp. TaxID=50421 RepID=UPI001D33D28D|nr:hypothetical protein [Rhodoferax sp.]MBU3897694.1 hypothetical protein [Gammaproteobacteria bacterium]MBU4112189.1 hypothetical protein [Gammaproteobacteria bacterium]MBU4172348.1 hypothetical protein [Gammaproteobacteria bacterium]